MDMSGFTEWIDKHGRTPVSIIVGALLMAGAVSSTYWATKDDLRGISTDVKQTNRDIEKIGEGLRDVQKRVNTLEGDMTNLEKREAGLRDKMESEVSRLEQRDQQLRNSYHEIQLGLREFGGKLDVTNSRLENLKTMLEDRD